MGPRHWGRWTWGHSEWGGQPTSKAQVHADKQGPKQVLSKTDYVSGDPGSQAGGIWNCSCSHSLGIQQVWGVFPPARPLKPNNHRVCLNFQLGFQKTLQFPHFLPALLPNHDFASMSQPPEKVLCQDGKPCRTRTLLPSWLQHPICLGVPEQGWGQEKTPTRKWEVTICKSFQLLLVHFSFYFYPLTVVLSLR